MRFPTMLAAAAVVATTPAAALEATGSLVVAPEWRTANHASPYAPAFARGPSATLRQDLALKLREGGFNAETRLRIEAAEDRRPERRGIVNQLYYDGDLGGGDAFTLGRKTLSWGVGFGFRPLDVVQRENRRGLNPAPLVGIPVVAWERYTADTAWTLLAANPLGERERRDDARAQALALRWYKLAANGDDLHAVARLSARQGLEAGAGMTRAAGDAWAFHAAALYQRRTAKLHHTLIGSATTLAAADPIAEEFRAHGLSAVLGAQWTDASSLGLLVEAWRDAAAWSRRDWRQLADLTARQRALAAPTGFAPQAAIDGNLAWSAQAFTRPNLLRDNLLLRLSYDAEQRWKYSLELLATPADGGHVLTAGVAWQGDRQAFSFGIRHLGGAADSAYALAPQRRLAYCQWTLALP